MQKTGGEKNCICLTFHPFATSFFFCCCAQFIHFMNTKKGGFLHFSQAFLSKKIVTLWLVSLDHRFFVSPDNIRIQSNEKVLRGALAMKSFVSCIRMYPAAEGQEAVKNRLQADIEVLLLLLKLELQITNRKTNEFLVFPCTSHEEESEQILFPLLLEKQLLCYTMRGLSKYKTLYSSQPSLPSSDQTLRVFERFLDFFSYQQN